jgi:hypothetical protein
MMMKAERLLKNIISLLKKQKKKIIKKFITKKKIKILEEERGDNYG